jgi:hypothetical protein
MTGMYFLAEPMLPVSPYRKDETKQIGNKNNHRQCHKKVLLRNHGVHPLIAATIQATPPTIPAIPAAIPKFLASVGAVTKTAAVVRMAATVHRTDAKILYVFELTLVSPSSLVPSLREANRRHNNSSVVGAKSL